MSNALNQQSNKKAIVVMLVVLFGVAGALVGVAYFGASTPSTKTATPSKNRNSEAGVDLGSSGNSSNYYQAFQQRIEESMKANIAKMQSDQEETLKALQLQQEAAMSRQNALLEGVIKSQRTQAETTGPATVDIEPLQITRMGSGRKDSGYFGSPSDVSTPVGQNVLGPTEEKKGKTSLVIPPNGFVSGKMLNGVIAVQGGNSQYVQIRLSGNYQSANSRVSNLDGCMVIGEAKADLSSSRVDIKPIKTTCTLPNGTTKTWETGGWIVDSDGIKGVRGLLVNNNDKKLALSAAAGAIGGAGQLMSQGQYTTSSSASGSSSSLTGNAARSMLGGMIQGGSSGLQNQVNEYFAAFQSSIQVGGGQDVTVVFTTQQELPEGGQTISTTVSVKD